VAGRALASTRLGLGLGPDRSTDARASPLANDGEQVVAKLATGQHVDDEVDRRVEDDHDVTDRRVVVMPVAALRTLVLVDKRPDDTVNERRRLTDHKDEDDDNQ